MDIKVASGIDWADVRGDVLVVTRRASDNKILRRIAVRNTITYNGMLGVIYLWKQDDIDPADYQIDSIRVGTGITPPTKDDPGLISTVFTVPLVSANRQRALPTKELVLTATLGIGDANGQTITEVGWFYKNGLMGGRQVHAPIEKTSLITITYAWRLGVTA